MPIINPWVFYLMHVADGVIIACIVVAVAVAVIGAFYWIFCSVDYGKPNWKAVKVACTLAAVVTVVAVLMPDSNTITRMIVAQNVTYERAEEATDTVKKVYEDIMSLFEEGG